MASPSVNFIRQHFPTEKYKRFRFQTNSLKVLKYSLFFIALGIFNIIPLHIALIFSSLALFSELPFFSFTRLTAAIFNLYDGRKKVKSLVMIISIALAAIAGVLFAFTGATQVSLLMAIIDYFSSALCSPALFFMGLLIGESLIPIKLASVFIGITLGLFLTSAGITVPLMVDVAFVCVMGTTFIASVIAKQAMRIYYKTFYDHSNADGYEINRSIEEKEAFVNEQAEKFGVTPDQFRALKDYCWEKIHSIKTASDPRLRYEDHHAFKDIYYGLMNPNAGQEELDAVRTVLSSSATSTVKRVMWERSDVEIDLIKQGLHESVLQVSADMKMLNHQVNLIAVPPGERLPGSYLPRATWRTDGLLAPSPGCGIEDDLVRPFLLQMWNRPPQRRLAAAQEVREEELLLGIRQF